MFELEHALAQVGGFARVTLQPAAGAHGELTGLMIIRAYHEDRGRRRTKVLIPDTAHGTNPASCTVNGFTTIQIPTAKDGCLDPEAVRPLLDDEVAGIMITNPNTIGLFERNIAAIAELVHGAGGLVYMDGANLNALMGKFRPGDAGVDVMHYNLHKTFGTPHGGGGPGSGPVGVREALVPFLPTPTVERDTNGRYRLDHHRPKSIGQVRSFLGKLGAEGLRQATEMAVLNANYLRVLLRDFLDVPFPDGCMHEVVASDHDLKPTEVTTLDVAKRLMDYGFHPPTVYFPLVVHGALMIEPTETETPQTLDCFVAALREIVADAHANPAAVRSAPHTTGLKRLNETQAARKPRLRWSPSET
jgi:glycine dehydrogenase subunit 2